MKITSSKFYKDMVLTISEIAKSYQISRNMITISENKVSSREFDFLDPYYLYVNRVNTSFFKLENSDKEILYNEFFNPSEEFWWKTVYNKRHFYSTKVKAMKNFLRVFNDD